MNVTINRDSLKAGPEKMKRLTDFILCLFDLNKCRAVAHSLEKIRVLFS